MDWFLTVPLLLVEVVLIMNLKEKTTMLSVKLGAAAALMIVLGYPGEISDDSGTRWLFWALAMIPFCYIVYTLFVGLSDSVARQPESVRELISMARYVTGVVHVAVWRSTAVGPPRQPPPTSTATASPPPWPAGSLRLHQS